MAPRFTKPSEPITFTCVTCGGKFETEESDFEKAWLMLRRAGAVRRLLGEKWVCFCPLHK